MEGQCTNIQGEGGIHDEDCRGIKIILHTMKICERISDRRLREETSIGEELFGCMPDRRIAGAIFTATQVMDKDAEDSAHGVY